MAQAPLTQHVVRRVLAVAIDGLLEALDGGGMVARRPLQPSQGCFHLDLDTLDDAELREQERHNAFRAEEAMCSLHACIHVQRIMWLPPGWGAIGTGIVGLMNPSIPCAN